MAGGFISIGVEPCVAFNAMVLLLFLLRTNSAARNQPAARLAFPILEYCLYLTLFTDEVISIQLALIAKGKCIVTVLASVTASIDSVPICTFGTRYRS